MPLVTSSLDPCLPTRSDQLQPCPSSSASAHSASLVALHLTCTMLLRVQGLTHVCCNGFIMCPCCCVGSEALCVSISPSCAPLLQTASGYRSAFVICPLSLHLCPQQLANCIADVIGHLQQMLHLWVLCTKFALFNLMSHQVHCQKNIHYVQPSVAVRRRLLAGSSNVLLYAGQPEAPASVTQGHDQLSSTPR